MSAILEINSIGSLAPYRDAWNALLSATPDADFFHSLDWLEVYWKYYGQDQKLRVLMLQEGGEIVGILPLAIHKEKTKVGRLRALGYPLHDWGSFYGPIGANQVGILTEGLKHIHATPRDWDILELGWMHNRPEASDNWIAKSFKEARFPSFERLHTEIPMIQLEGDWETYWAKRTGKIRNNCRRHIKGLEKIGDIELIRYRPKGALLGEEDPRWDLYEKCEEIARASWQGSSTTGTTLTHANISNYLRDTHLRAVQCGAVDLILLMVADQPAAYSYNYFHQGRVSGLRCGFHSSLARLSPGTVLTYYTVRDSFERGDSLIDLLPGSLAAKRHWKTTIEKSYRYSHYPLSLGRVQALRLKRWWELWRNHRTTTSQDNPTKAIAG